MTLAVGILVFDEVEVLDLGGPFEVFSVASRMAGRRGAAAPFQPIMIAKSMAPVAARGGFRVLPHATLTDHPPLDVLLVPGGVTAEVEQDAEVLAWVRHQATRTRLTASVCTGAFVLAGAGLLDGRPVTTHWEDQADLAARFPQLRVLSDRAWVDDGDIITSGGISAGIEMSLHLVERLHSRELAMETARQMDYTWTSIQTGERV